MLVFTDLETTGLDPDRELPLELGIVVTTDVLKPVRRQRYLMQYERDDLDSMRRVCGYKGHEDTGLWWELYHLEEGTDKDPADAVPLPGLDEALIQLADECGFLQQDRPQMAGFGVHFDQRFLRRWCPRYLQRIHYRLLDVRTLAEEVRRKYGDWGPPASGPHRAMPDCDAAIDYLRWYRAHVMTPYGPGKGSGSKL